MRRILVTGGAGFIGSHLVDRLAQEPSNEIIVLDNLRRGRLCNLARSMPHIRFVTGDVCDGALLRQLLPGVDLVYHLAAQSNVLGAVTDIEYSFSSNVTGTFEVLRAARACDVRRVIFSSSREVYGDPAELPVSERAPVAPKNAYGASKAAGEMYCRIFSGPELEVLVLRLANVYGPRDFDRVIPIFLHQAQQNLPLTLYGGKQLLDFVWIDTVVEAFLRAAECEVPSEPINVGSGKATVLLSLAERILSLSGSSSRMCISPSREVEVSRFVADTTEMQRVFQILPPDDPLQYLPDLIAGQGKRFSERAAGQV